MTEFVNVDGLCSRGRDKVIRKLGVELDTTPVIAQIWGKTPENFETIAREIAEGIIPGFVGVDLNFGCPEKGVVKNECCSAMQQPHLREKARAIIDATQRGLGNKLPLSIKTRLGFDQIDYSWHEFLLGFNPSMLTVHVRTTRQMSKVPALWEAILPIIELRDRISPDTKSIMNGDIIDAKHGKELAEKYGVYGIMIVRVVFHNPYCVAVDGQVIWQVIWQVGIGHGTCRFLSSPASARPLHPSQTGPRWQSNLWHRAQRRSKRFRGQPSQAPPRCRQA